METGQVIGPYRLEQRLGEGGMGVVFAAFDDRLGRRVALKVIKGNADPQSRERLRREARAAAAVNHPNICQIFDIVEHDGDTCVVMELLEGESLDARLSRGSMPVATAIEVMLGTLAALDTLHSRQIIHRDLKPSNIFLGPNGVKLLDFGLALATSSPEALTEQLRLTTPGTLIGTPRYMAPEQWATDPVSPATDLFTCGAILFEMVTGQPAFTGDTLPMLCHAVMTSSPRALTGGPDIDALDRVVQRALAKSPAGRFQSAAAMAEALRIARPATDATVSSEPIRTVTRLIVLPFRLLRADAEIEFLSFSLPDAITASLCGLDSLVVRSSRVAARFGNGEPDLKAIASEADVDVVLVGNLLRGGDRVRLQTQLVEVPSGTLIWSRSLQASMSDIFELEDTLRDQLLESLSIPLSQRQHERIDRDKPVNGHAYTLFLRANEIGSTTTSTARLVSARSLYQRCVEEDPSFAPAWARLARVLRIMGKFGHGDEPHRDMAQARDAFTRAFALNPDLPLAHAYFTYFQLDELAEAPEAVVRLLGRIRSRAADPMIYDGLVVACRFCGLFDASIAAFERARRLDPRIQTSVHYTYWLRGDLDEAMRLDHEAIPVVRVASLIELGRVDEAEAIFRRAETEIEGLERVTITGTLAAIRNDGETVRKLVDDLLASSFHDPEGIYLAARLAARTGLSTLALDALERSVRGNFSIDRRLMRDPWLTGLHGLPRFQSLVDDARARRLRALAMFAESGGPELLGVDEQP